MMKRITLVLFVAMVAASCTHDTSKYRVRAQAIPMTDVVAFMKIDEHRSKAQYVDAGQEEVVITGRLFVNNDSLVVYRIDTFSRLTPEQ